MADRLERRVAERRVADGARVQRVARTQLEGAVLAHARVAASKAHLPWRVVAHDAAALVGKV